MKKLFISLSFVIFLILVGCKETPTQPLDTSVIWPLKVGNYWEYRVYFYDSSGNITFENTETTSVDSVTLLGGNNVYIVRRSVGGISYYFNSRDGLYSYDFSLNENDTSYIIFKYPAIREEFYQSYIDSIYVASTNDSLNVPSGSFTCYNYQWERYDEKNYQYKTNSYYSPGIGNIKIEIHVKDNSGRYFLCGEKILISYKLN